MCGSLRVLYLINSLEVGGAELGLVNLLNRGVFSEFNFDIVTVWAPNCQFLVTYPNVHSHLRTTLLPDGDRKSRGLMLALWRFIKTAKRLRPDVVIASLPQSVLISRLARLFGGDFRVITFEHSERLGSNIATILFRGTTIGNDGVVADSFRTLTKVFKSHWYPQDIPRCIVPLQDLSVCFQRPLPIFIPDRLYLIFVGRLDPVKNLSNCLGAVRVARDSGVPVSLAIFGDGEQRTSLVEEVRKLKLTDVVQFHGMAYDWIHHLPSDGAFGLVASEREGLSVSALQLLALGFPLITTGVGAISSYLVDGESGVVAADTTSAAIAVALKKAWSCRTDWAQMSAAARSSAVNFEQQLGMGQRDAEFRQLLLRLSRRRLT